MEAQQQIWLDLLLTAEQRNAAHILSRSEEQRVGSVLFGDEITRLQSSLIGGAVSKHYFDSQLRLRERQQIEDEMASGLQHFLIRGLRVPASDHFRDSELCATRQSHKSEVCRGV